MDHDGFARLVSLLIEKKYRITAAESCTGGLFCAGIVSVADASKVFDRGFVTYSEDAKAALVGVSPETIAEYGVVSVQTAAEMARGACEKAGAAVGVGITGFAGPSGGDRFAPLGTVCFGFCVNGAVFTERKDFGALGRNLVREESVRFACERLCALLENL